MKNFTPFKHQTETTKFILSTRQCFIGSDPGTGKTRAVLDAYDRHSDGKLLVLCPKSIMYPAWVSDVNKFTPHLDIKVANTPDKKRKEAFKSRNIVVINHDGIHWLIKNKILMEDFKWIVIDESTAFKNPTAKRTRSLLKLIKDCNFNYRICMSGTPTPNSITELFSQIRIIDDGQSLGTNFYKFRSEVCTPDTTFPQFVKWVDREDAKEKIFAAIQNKFIRHTLEETIDMPEQHTYDLNIPMSSKLFHMYRDLLQESYLQLKKGTITALNAAILGNKLLQLCSGAVYSSKGKGIWAHSERYDLIVDLIKGREHSLVACQWRHQINVLSEMLEHAKIPFCTISANDTAEKRNNTVEQFQAGHFRALIAHPATAAHGLTLTRARSVIWASPTFNSEHYLQFNRRIYRIGQTNRTEIIHVVCEGTIEKDVYDALNNKVKHEFNILKLFEKGLNIYV